MGLLHATSERDTTPRAISVDMGVRSPLACAMGAHERSAQSSRRKTTTRGCSVGLRAMWGMCGVRRDERVL